MKLTSLSLIFLAIIAPFLFISAQQCDISIEDAKLRYYYDNIIDNAIQDAALILTQNTFVSYSFDADITHARALAAQAFFDSLYHAFNADRNPSLIARVNACVPILVFLERDGYFIYGLDSYKNNDGHTVFRHCWFPKQHYVGEPIKDRYIVRYTLENKVAIYDQTENKYLEGDYREYKNEIPLFEELTFRGLRLNAVKNSIEKDIRAYIARYNMRTQSRSISAELEFPGIDDADWKRAITDEGMIVFAQGFPVLQGKSYKHYALGGARIIRRNILTGYEHNGHLYYCRPACEYLLNSVMTDSSFDPDNIIYFTNAGEAAGSGYYPCPRCRP